MTDPRYVLAFREGVSLAEKDGVTSVEANGQSVPLKRASPAIAEALRALAAGATEGELARSLEASEPASLPVLFFYLERFRGLGLLSFSVRSGGAVLATLEWAPAEAMSRAAVLPAAPDPGRRYALSRFAMIRRLGGRLVLECPLARGMVVLHDARALAFCHALGEPRDVASLSEQHPEASLLLGLLLGCRAVTLDGPDGESGDGALAVWSPHDLYFHTRARWGRTADRVGTTFRFAGTLPPLPVLKPGGDGPRTPLFRPDIEALRESDVPFTRVVEERRSLRTHGPEPIDARQIGELLFRAARVRSFGTATGSVTYAISNRPYPGGGACYELELYLAVGSCRGLSPGLYHYEPEEHALSAVPCREPALAALLAGARHAMLAPAPPQVLLVFAARFGRVMWKYESTAYATILKDVGALLQTVYLVATAMGLAPCAVGTGDSDAFAAAAGLDYFAETSVGEMALGSRVD